MTKVSRLPLRPDVWERIFDLFINTLANINGRQKLRGFVGSLFSPTERIMLAKRLAAAVMIAKGNDYSTIRRVLRISPPTIAKMSFLVKYEGDELTPIISDILRKDRTRVLWTEIEELFDIPGKGKSFSGIRKRTAERRRKIQRLKTEL